MTPAGGPDPRAVAAKIAPVQGYSAGIPWSLHLRAYDVYCKLYGRQQALIEGGCRGGFGTGELDMFVPGWRDEVSEIGRLKAALAASEARAAAAEAMAEVARAEALREAQDIATRAGEEMTERGAWDEGMRDMAVRIIMRLRAARALQPEPRS